MNTVKFDGGPMQLDGVDVMCISASIGPKIICGIYIEQNLPTTEAARHLRALAEMLERQPHTPGEFADSTASKGRVEL